MEQKQNNLESAVNEPVLRGPLTGVRSDGLLFRGYSKCVDGLSYLGKRVNLALIGLATAGMLGGMEYSCYNFEQKYKACKEYGMSINEARRLSRRG